MVKKPYPVPDRMIYYDYWIKFLNQLKKILSLDDLYEMESDLMKLVQCIDGRYACHIPHCNKKNDYCNYEGHRECEMYEEGI